MFFENSLPLSLHRRKIYAPFYASFFHSSSSRIITHRSCQHQEQASSTKSVSQNNKVLFNAQESRDNHNTASSSCDAQVKQSHVTSVTHNYDLKRNEITGRQNVNLTS